MPNAVSRVWINGEVSDGLISVTDSSVLRGDGCFEVLRSFEGRVVALDLHLDRLANSAARMMIPLPERHILSGWVRAAAAECPSGVVRVVVTRGSAIPGESRVPLVIVFSHLWDSVPSEIRLLPVVAPWHSAGQDWELRGVKMLSYAPNLSASRAAVAVGFGDALLTTPDQFVLEGPTFSVAWIRDGVFETPSLDLGILDSVTRGFAIEAAEYLGISVEQRIWPMSRLYEAEEVLALSTVRRVQRVSAVGEKQFTEEKTTRLIADELVQMSGSNS